MFKSPTGITGFDDIAMGGLPTGRTTLLTGGPGSGKTVFALQTLAHWASTLDTPGIFVAFEQDPAVLRADAATFDWGLGDLSENVLSFIDSRPKLDLAKAGAFDIAGMLALLQVQVEATGAKAIVFDGIDVLLAQMADPDLIRRELYRLQGWLSEAGVTALITCKSTISDPRFIGLPSLEFLQYMVDCSVFLNNDIVDDVSQRNLRIAKFRGSGFHGNAVPFLIGRGGIDVTLTHASRPAYRQGRAERLSSGQPGVDRMLQGGYAHSACVLLTGLPGTGKTTLSASFVAAACARGEKALYISFVSRSEEIVQNLQALSIDLEPFLESGHLRFVSTRASIGSGETHLRSIRSIAEEHDASCIVIDPMSALTSFVNRRTSPGVTERLIDWAKDGQRTLVCTGLLGNPCELVEPPILQISTIADTWIHLDNSIIGNARRRSLSILKSRGSGHSSHVREFVLSDSGMALTDASVDGGRV